MPQQHMKSRKVHETKLPFSGRAGWLHFLTVSTAAPLLSACRASKAMLKASTFAASAREGCGAALLKVDAAAAIYHHRGIEHTAAE